MRLAKVIITFISAILLITAISVFPQRLCFKQGENYTFYCGTSSSDCKEVTVTDNAAKERLFLKNVCGESTVYNEIDIQDFLNSVNGEILFTEKLSDSVNYYCSANLPYSVNINGKTVNLHISVRGNATKVASPIIFGGF